MKQSYRRLALACLTLVAAALAAPSALSRGQEGGATTQARLIAIPASDTVLAETSVAAPAHTAASSAQPAAPFQATSLVYLPIVQQAPFVIISPVQFASERDADGNLVNPRSVFAYGVTQMFAAATIKGAEGSKYILRWLVRRGRDPANLPDTTGTLGSNARRIVSGFCFVEEGFDCTNRDKGRPIDRQTIVYQIFLDGALVVQGTAVIQ